MPDAGDFEKQAPAPAAWTDAFAALPQGAPPHDAWQRLQTRLPAATRRRQRWPLWLATAATLALAVAIPLKLRTGPVRPLSPAGSVATASAVADTARIHASPDPAPVRETPTPEEASTRTAVPASARRDPARRITRIPPSQRPIRTAAPPADSTRVAAAKPQADALEPLYAQSAQLESLLAIARDDRVASGPSAALSDDLDAELARIDAALIQPGLAPTQRSGLWRQRVDALQQLVGIETTRRLYAARGQSYDAALVSID